jgi:hypothetical protein
VFEDNVFEEEVSEHTQFHQSHTQPSSVEMTPTAWVVVGPAVVVGPVVVVGIYK